MPTTNYSFLDAAEAVLRTAERPLSPHEIVQCAIAEGLITTSGKTPAQTMKAKLSTDILKRREASRFMRTGMNLFALRASMPYSAEYVATRYEKALLDEDIVVFDRPLLKQIIPIPGIHPMSAAEGRTLAQLCYPMQRLEAENDTSVIQLVSQFLVRLDRRIATYKRTRRLPEARLHGVFSMLFGGHLNPDDIPPLFGILDPDIGPMYIQRELQEELRFSQPPRLDLVGILYDPRSEVSEQHIGILYEVTVTGDTEIVIGERGFLQQLTLETPEEICGRISDFENWSELVLRDYVIGGEA